MFHHLQEQLRRRNLFEILSLVWNSSRRWTVLLIVFVAIDSVFPVLILYATKLILDTVEIGLNSGINLNEMFNQVLVFVILLATLTIISRIIQSLIDYAFRSLSEYVSENLYTTIQLKAVEVDLSSYETPEYYDILHRAKQEVSYRPTQVIDGLLRVGKNGLSLIGVILLLAAFDPVITVILILAGFPGIVARFFFSRKMYFWERDQSQKNRQVSYINSVLTSQDHAKENRLFSLSSYFSHRSLKLRRELRTELLSMVAKYHVYELTAQIITSIVIFSLFAIVIQRTLSGLISIGDLVMYYQAFEKGQAFLRGFLGGIVEIYENSLFISNLYEFLKLEAKIVDPPQPVDFPKPFKQGITIKNVNFNYPASEREALKNINMSISPNQTVAIVGENGSGKTTLIKLLCRLYDPCDGSIEVDGLPLTDFRIEDLRSQISVVFQDYVQYHLTARENIWLSRLDLSIDSPKIISAAKYSGVDAVISELSNGYDTILGKRLSDGEELSIGEWQKIAISRAYLRDSQILILDEPTSALDAKSEYEVFEKFRELAQDKATILISHRLSTIKMADHIYYMENGEIVEHGTHEELVKQAGRYASMYEVQAQNYR